MGKLTRGLVVTDTFLHTPFEALKITASFFSTGECMDFLLIGSPDLYTRDTGSARLPMPCSSPFSSSAPPRPHQHRHSTGEGAPPSHICPFFQELLQFYLSKTPSSVQIGTSVNEDIHSLRGEKENPSLSPSGDTSRAASRSPHPIALPPIVHAHVLGRSVMSDTLRPHGL